MDFSKSLPSGWAPHPVSKAEPNNSWEKAHFHLSYLRSDSFSHYPELLTRPYSWVRVGMRPRDIRGKLLVPYPKEALYAFPTEDHGLELWGVNSHLSVSPFAINCPRWDLKGTRGSAKCFQHTLAVCLCVPVLSKIPTCHLVQLVLTTALLLSSPESPEYTAAYLTYLIMQLQSWSLTFGPGSPSARSTNGLPCIRRWCSVRVSCR